LVNSNGIQLEYARAGNSMQSCLQCNEITTLKQRFGNKAIDVTPETKDAQSVNVTDDRWMSG